MRRLQRIRSVWPHHCISCERFNLLHRLRNNVQRRYQQPRRNIRLHRNNRRNRYAVNSVINSTRVITSTLLLTGGNYDRVEIQTYLIDRVHES